jgi:hypothetical protein
VCFYLQQYHQLGQKTITAWPKFGFSFDKTRGTYRYKVLIMPRRPRENHALNNQRWSEMPQTLKNVQDTLEEFLIHAEQSNFRKTDRTPIFPLIRKRIEGADKLVKAYFFSKAYGYLYEKPFEVVASDELFGKFLPFVVEVLMCVQYLDNQIFDSKANVNTQTSICKNIFEREELLSTLYSFIDLKLTKAQAQRLKKGLGRIMEKVNWGQKMEKNANLFPNFEKREPTFLINPSNTAICHETVKMVQDLIETEAPWMKTNSDFLTAYLQRIYLVGASFYPAMVELMIELSGVKPSLKRKKSMLTFAKRYGMYMQLLNDIRDFLPAVSLKDSASKLGKDAFNDLRTSNVTLPIQLCLNQKKSPVKKEMRRHLKKAYSFSQKGKKLDLSDLEQSELFLALWNDKSLHTSFSITDQLSEKTLSDLEYCNLHFPELADMLLANCHTYWRDFKRHHRKTSRNLLTHKT